MRYVKVSLCIVGLLFSGSGFANSDIFLKAENGQIFKARLLGNKLVDKSGMPLPDGTYSQEDKNIILQSGVIVAQQAQQKATRH